ncbi:MAG: tetratricopeptide repeat protein [Pseudomonadota bacterium]
MKRSALIATTSALLFSFNTQAATPNEYTVLLKAKKYSETEQAANARLAQDPANGDALVAKARAILGAGHEERIDEAVKLGEQCITAHPQQSECHEQLGNALGSKAVNAGIMSAMGYVGKIRDEFKKAVELDPQNMSARFSLQQFYLQAPSIAGGGSGKAKTLAEETAKLSADAATLMLAKMEIADDEFAKAEALATKASPAPNTYLSETQRDVLISIANAYARAKKYAESERLFRDVQKRYPDAEWAPYGLARAMQDQGKHADAIALFEKSLAISVLPSAYYRIGQSWQALHDKPKAIAAYEKALASKSGIGKKIKADAEDQLKALR